MTYKKTALNGHRQEMTKSILDVIQCLIETRWHETAILLWLLYNGK